MFVDYDYDYNYERTDCNFIVALFARVLVANGAICLCRTMHMPSDPIRSARVRVCA